MFFFDYRNSFAGDTGQGFLNWIKFLIGDFASPHINFVFPTAPLRPYTPLKGEVSLHIFSVLVELHLVSNLVLINNPTMYTTMQYCSTVNEVIATERIT